MGKDPAKHGMSGPLFNCLALLSAEGASLASLATLRSLFLRAKLFLVPFEHGAFRKFHLLHRFEIRLKDVIRKAKLEMPKNATRRY